MMKKITVTPKTKKRSVVVPLCEIWKRRFLYNEFMEKCNSIVPLRGSDFVKFHTTA